MKRADLVRHLENHGCRFVREGGNHSVWCSHDRMRFSAVLRHREVNNFTARNICRDLDIPAPKQK